VNREQQTPEQPPRSEEPSGPEPVEPLVTLPRWVGVAIGVILVAMAGLAVYTGLRYRGASLGKVLVHRPARPLAPAAGGVPGEPEPGASRVMPGDSGAGIPEANPPVSTSPPLQIKGEGKEIIGTRRLSVRRGVLFKVVPDDALVYVNNVAIGPVKQFNTADEVYEFPAEGSYSIRIVAPGYRGAEFVVNSDANAKDDVATIEARLPRE
jgi:hypothetical protein